MNDLMTKSFLSYVDLKKQIWKDDQETEYNDIETGRINPYVEENLVQFFTDVDAIKAEMEAITTLLVDLQELNEETKSTHSAKVLRGLRDRMDSDMVTILRTARIIKARLVALDQSNVTNRSISVVFQEGSYADRTRIGVTNGLRIKLRDMMNEFQELRNRIVLEHKEGLKRRYFNATGKVATEEEIDKMVSTNGQVMIFAGNSDFDLENKERQEAVRQIQRSLTELHQVFLDMAVLVDAQGVQMDDIALNVANAKEYISGGTDRLVSANAMRKNGGNLVYWVWLVVLILFLICLIATFT
ncbi:pantetheine-phosphate adenylyltransferase [Ranunculus cassubicifolius]